MNVNRIYLLAVSIRIILFCFFISFYNFNIFFNDYAYALFISKLCQSGKYISRKPLPCVVLILCVFWKVEAKHSYYTLMIIGERQWKIELQVASSCSSLFPSLCLALLPQWQIYWLTSASGSSPDALLWTHRDNSYEKPILSQGFLHLPPFTTLILQLDGACFQISIYEPTHSPVRDG